MDIILASSSPRRIDLMNQFNIKFRVVSSDCDETISSSLKPEEVVQELSKRKCMHVFDNNPDSLVLGFDTIVAYNGDILGKPKDKEDCIRMIKELSGNTHSVFTGCFFKSKDFEYSFTEETKVEFKELTDEEIIAYADTKEPYDKAGAYGIQGTFRKYILKFDGDYYNVMGLPKEKVYKILMDYINKRK